MKINFEIAQIIERPADQVFVFLSDLSNMKLWNYYIQSVSKVSDGDIGCGTLFEEKRPHDSNLYKITQYEVPYMVTVELQPPGPLQQYAFELKPMENKTQVAYSWRVDLEKYKILRYIPNGVFKNWILSFAKRHVLTKIKPATEQNFLKLKTLLETGQVILQDGIHVSLPAKKPAN